MTKNKPSLIGVFDSGLGGLTVFDALLRELPDEDFLYVGDTARVPYGVRSEATIQRYSLEAVDFLLAQGVQAIVIACNTATACTGELLIRHAHPIPVFGVIDPGIQAVADLPAKYKRQILVAGTRATIRSQEYQRRLQALFPTANIHSRACALFVSLVEEGWSQHPITRQVIHAYFDEFQQVQTLLLACTHFPLLKNAIRAEFPHFQIVDSGTETARRVADWCASSTGAQWDERGEKPVGRRVEICLTDVRPPKKMDLTPFSLSAPVTMFREISLAKN